MSVKTERLGNMLHREISNILMTEIKDINGAKKFIRSILMKKKIEMRVIPELSFVYDDSIDYGNKIESIIEKIHEEDK